MAAHDSCAPADGIRVYLCHVRGAGGRIRSPAGRGAAPVVGMLAITALARVMLHLSVRQRGSSALQLAVLPLRDALSLALWAWSFVTRRVAVAGGSLPRDSRRIGPSRSPGFDAKAR